METTINKPDALTEDCVLKKILSADMDRTTILFAEMALKLSECDPEANNIDYDKYMIEKLGLTPEEVDVIISEFDWFNEKK